MSDVWTLCPISKPVMERCVANAGTRDQRNKWLEEFKKKHTDSEFGKNLYRLLKETGDALEQKESQESEDEEKFEEAQESLGKDEEAPNISDEAPKKPEVDRLAKKNKKVKKAEKNSEEETKVPLEKDMDELVELIETEPNARFDLMLEEGSKYSVLHNILAERLAESTIDKLCKQLFEAKSIDPLYVKSFYTNFFPVYFKRSYTSFSLDLLLKARKSHPNEFCGLLEMLLLDVQVSSKMMDDFVGTLDGTGKLEFLNTALKLELDTPEFVHNITAILEAYKASDKSEMTQMYVYNCLLRHATKCLTNWNYGRLMLTYLQAVDALRGKLNFMYCERLIKIHNSPFKRPCMNLFVEMMEKASEEHMYPKLPKIQGFED